MVRFMSFSSGSCGNCYYIGTEDSGLLIDAGVSLRRLKSSLADNGIPMDSILGILVTHDHLDHIRHLGTFCKKICKPVYTTSVLHDALSKHTFTSKYITSCRNVLAEGENDIGGIKVRYFEVPHDATQTVGFSIEIDNRKFVIMTDLGQITNEAVEYASKADAVVIESNYDVDMLLGGPYTYELKMRIVHGNGHLSNDDCANAIKRFLHPGIRNIFLCHLSENNNTPQKAYASSIAAISEVRASKSVLLSDNLSLRCLPRTSPSPIIII